MPAGRAGQLMLLLGGPRHGWVYSARTPPATVEPYQPTGELTTLAQVFPRRYLGETTREAIHEIYRLPATNRQA